MPERYEFIRKVAQGGFGRVYVAKDTRLGREVAIKRLLEADHTAAQDQAEATFQREATTLAAMQHPNIVQIFDFDRDEEGSFVVMELLDGETLKERLDRGPLSWETFIKIAREALEAINAAHSKGILHRDLKPENLFLQKTPSGTRIVKILDFGLAKLSQAPSKQTMDQQGNVFGSIYYMAPEQFRRETLDARTDLYALGCVFYQSLTQRFPFYGEKMHDTMDAHLQHKVKPLLERRPEINPAVADWVMRLISLKASDRPQDAMTALRQFEAALQGPVSAAVAELPVQVIAQASTRPAAPMPQPMRTVATPPSTKTTASVGAINTPMQTRAVSALEASRAEARMKMEAAAKRNRLALMIGAPVVGAIVLLFVLNRPQGNSPASGATGGGKSASSTPAKPLKPEDMLPSVVMLTLPMEDFLTWRFRAGVETWHKGNDGKQQNSQPRRDQKVHVWKNIAGKQADPWLKPYENKADRAAKLFDADVNLPGNKHQYVFFSTGSGMESRLSSAEQAQAPGGPNSNPAGATIAAVFRANGNSKERTMRPVLLTTTKGTDSFSLHLSHRVGQYWAQVQHGGQPVQSLVRPDQFAKSGAGGNWVVAVAAWDAKQGTVILRVRSPDGKIATGPEAPLPPGMAVLDRLNLGLFYPPKDSKLDPKEKMDGDIVEVVVYRQALDRATQEKVLNAMWDRYFKMR